MIIIILTWILPLVVVLFLLLLRIAERPDGSMVINVSLRQSFVVISLKRFQGFLLTWLVVQVWVHLLVHFMQKTLVHLI